MREDEEVVEEPVREQQIIQYGAEGVVNLDEMIDYRYRNQWCRVLFDECVFIVVLVLCIIGYLIIHLRER
jgi:hypothetical protein